MTEIQWTKARCPICGREYEYMVGGYKPATCAAYKCLYEYLHNRPPIPKQYQNGQSDNEGY